MDESNKKFWKALKRFIIDAQIQGTNPIDSDIELHYNYETHEVTAKRVGGIQTDNDGGTGGGTSYPP